MKGEGVGLIDSFALSKDLRMGTGLPPPMFTGPIKQKLVPHGQTSKGSVAWVDAALVVCFMAAGCERQLGERGLRLSPGESHSHAQRTSRWAPEGSGAEGSQEAAAPQPVTQAGEGKLWPLLPHPIPQFLRSWCLITGARRVNSHLFKAGEWLTFLP